MPSRWDGSYELPVQAILHRMVIYDNNPICFDGVETMRRLRRVPRRKLGLAGTGVVLILSGAGLIEQGRISEGILTVIIGIVCEVLAKVIR